jgi:IS30 family transposase
MLTLRCTEKLCKKLRLPKLGDAPASTTTLGDWFGNPVSTRHARVILLVNEKSRLAVLVAARQFDRFEQRFRDAVADLLLDLGVQAEAVVREIEAMHDLVYARTNSRSVLGTMNDYTLALHFGLEGEPEKTLHEQALHLSETPCRPLGYASPHEVVLTLLSGDRGGQWIPEG